MAGDFFVHAVNGSLHRRWMWDVSSQLSTRTTYLPSTTDSASARVNGTADSVVADHLGWPSILRDRSKARSRQLPESTDLACSKLATIAHSSSPPLAEQTRIVAEVERRFSVLDELETAVSPIFSAQPGCVGRFCSARSRVLSFPRGVTCPVKGMWYVVLVLRVFDERQLEN